MSDTEKTLPYSLLEETPDRFLLQHEDGSPLTIAKDKTPESLHTKLRALPTPPQQGWVAGQRPVTQFAEAVPTPTEDIPAPTEDWKQRSLHPPLPMPVPTDSPMPTSPMGDAADTSMPTAGQVGKPQPGGFVPLPGTPLETAPSPLTQADLGLVGYGQAYRQMQAGIQEKALAESEGAKQAAIIQGQYADQIKKMNDYYTNKRVELEKDTAAREADVMSAKVDPNRWWSQQTPTARMGKHVLAFIGAFLGGGAQMRTGVNPTVQALQNLINQDIDAQKEDIGNKRFLLSQNMAKYGNLQAAETATRLDMANMVSAQIGQIGSQTQSQSVMAAAKQAQGALKLEQAKLAHELAIQSATVKMMSGAGQNGMDDQGMAYLTQYAPEAAKRMVKIPTGDAKQPFVWRPARSDKDADELNKAMIPLATLKSAIQDMKTYLADPNASELTGWTDKAYQASAMRTRAVQAYRAIGEALRMGEYSEGFVNKLIPNVAGWHRGKAIAKLEQLERDVKANFEANIQSRMIFNSPAEVTTTPYKTQPGSVK